MYQLNLFNSEDNNQPSPSPISLPMPQAAVLYYPDFFGAAESNRLFEELRQQIEWRQETLRFAGKSVLQPRLTAWYGEDSVNYTYSGLTLAANFWNAPLLDIKRKIEPVTGITFNSVLLNLYRDGRDSVAWHSDNEPELGQNPYIASVSFGAARKFQFKHILKPELRHEILLTHGSLLLMRGETQQYWKHQIPKTASAVGERINLTFRNIF